MVDEYRKNCKGCQLSCQRRHPDRKWKAIALGDNWILSHYGGSEAFLGWMALQPRYHREDLAHLQEEEAKELGIYIRRIDKALRAYWSHWFGDDNIERVYVVYFNEGAFNPDPERWHLHFHLIPRTERLGKDEFGQGYPSKNAAWKTAKLTCNPWFPEEYRIPKVGAEERVNELLRELGKKLHG